MRNIMKIAIALSAAGLGVQVMAQSVCPPGMILGKNSAGYGKCFGTPNWSMKSDQISGQGTQAGGGASAPSPPARSVQAPRTEDAPVQAPAQVWRRPVQEAAAKPAPPIDTTPDPFSFPNKTDGWTNNVYFHDFKVTGLEPWTPFKLTARAIGKVGISNPLNAGRDGVGDGSEGSWNEDQEVMTNQYGEIAVRIRNMAPPTVGGTATVLFTLRYGENAVAASGTWSVTTAKPFGLGLGYWGDPNGPSGFVGRDTWNPK